MNVGKPAGEPPPPCTPHGVIQLLVRAGHSPEGKHVVVCGRSNLVGKPLAALLIQKKKGANATVTICHTGTPDIRKFTLLADILVAAMGSPRIIKADMVREGCVVIDVGVNRVDDPAAPKGYRLIGDCDFEALKEKAAAITPSRRRGPDDGHHAHDEYDRSRRTDGGRRLTESPSAASRCRGRPGFSDAESERERGFFPVGEALESSRPRGGRKMKIGKIDDRTFSALIRNRLGRPDPTVLVPPQTGVDAGVVDIGGGRVLVVAEDPIFTMPRLPLRMFGWFTVHIGASDVAVMGVKPRYMTYSLLLPPETGTGDLRTLIDSIHRAARELDIAIVGGHTGFYPGFAAPTIGGITVFAVAKKGDYVTPAGARPGDAVILTKGPAIETAALLSVLREEELRGRYPDRLIRKAKSLCRSISVVRDALAAVAAGGVTAMHDATEGERRPYEIAVASGVGLEADERLVLYPP
jgi:hydrogenase maturation factor